MVFPTKGVLWLPEKVECLLRILHRLEAGPRIMPSTHLETMEVFGEASAIMRTRGYRRSALQCRVKFKREKATLFDALEDWDGIPPAGERPPVSTFCGRCGNRAAGRDGAIAPRQVRRPRARRVQQAPAQEEAAAGSPGDCVEEPQEAGRPRARRVQQAPPQAEQAPSPPRGCVEEQQEAGKSPRMVEVGTLRGTPVVISSAMQVGILLPLSQRGHWATGLMSLLFPTEGGPHSDPGEGPSAPPATQQLARLVRDMAQLQVSVARCEQRVVTALERIVELSRLMTQMQLDDAIREQQREDLERRNRVAQPPMPHRGWRAVREEGSGDADSEGASAGGTGGSSEGGSEGASARGIAEASTEEEAEGPNQAIPPDPDWGGEGVGESETDSE
ncbi:UNVERIFIED_CONTAM: hypothetical protein K2H54_060757 [Gekko kuhli]